MVTKSNFKSIGCCISTIIGRRYHFFGIEAICFTHLWRFVKDFASFSTWEQIYDQLKYALMSAIVNEVPTRKVFCFSLSSNCLATLMTASLALMVCSSLTSARLLVSKISTPTAGSSYFSMSSNHWLIWDYVRDIMVLVGRLWGCWSVALWLWGWNVCQRRTDEGQFIVLVWWRVHYFIGTGDVCSHRGQVHDWL